MYGSRAATARTSSNRSQQHRGRIPLARQEPVAQRRRQRASMRSVAGGDRAGRDVGRDGRRPGVASTSACSRSIVVAARRRSTACRASPRCPGRSPRTIRRSMARNAGAREPLRRVLARRAAAEVRVDDEDRRAGVARIVERVLRVGGAIVLEQVPLEPLERHGSQEARRHDAIGVDVVAAQRQRRGRRHGGWRLTRGSDAGRSCRHSFQHLAHVDDFAGNRGRRDHRRAHQQRAAGRAALAPLEVAVRRRGARSGGLRAGRGSCRGTSSSRRRAIRTRRR